MCGNRAAGFRLFEKKEEGKAGEAEEGEEAEVVDVGGEGGLLDELAVKNAIGGALRRRGRGRG